MIMNANEIMQEDFFSWPLLRRRDLLATACLLWAGVRFAPLAQASPEEARQFLADLVKTERWTTDQVSITLPPVTDQWRFVPIRVSVKGKGTEEIHVREIHLVGERNPSPHIVSFRLSASSPPIVTTKIRLVKTQIVIAAAVLDNGVVLVGKELCKVVVPGKGCG